jgi:hypothetical protein
MGGAATLPPPAVAGLAPGIGRDIVQFLIVRVRYTGAAEDLAETGRALLDATSGVVDATRGSVAVLAGKIDGVAPGLAFRLATPTDRFIDRVADHEWIGQAADLVLHFPIAIRAHGHVGFSLRTPGGQGRAGL